MAEEIVILGPTTEIVLTVPPSEIVVEDKRTIIEDNTPVVQIIELAKQGVPGSPGAPGKSIEVDFGTIGAGNTETVDSLLVVTERCVQWLVCAETAGGGKSQTWMVLAVNDGSGASHNVFGKVREPVAGGPLSVGTVVDVLSGAMRLRLTNNEGFGVDVSVCRLSVSP